MWSTAEPENEPCDPCALDAATEAHSTARSRPSAAFAPPVRRRGRAGGQGAGGQGAGGPEGRSGLLGECAEVELDDLRVVEQVGAAALVGVAALVEHVRPVGDEEAAPRVLLDHDD